MWYMNKERELIRNAARDFALKEIKPVIGELEETCTHPVKLTRKMGELGLLGLLFSDEEGGTGIDWISHAIVAEEIAKESLAVAAALLVNGALAPSAIRLASPKQREEWFKPCLAGEKILAFSITEPAGVFNFPEHVTNAVFDGDNWVINGGKIFCTNAGQADAYLLICKTAEFDPLTFDGLSMIIVPATTPGFEMSRLEKKMGQHATWTGQIFFKNCRVPKENLVGPLGKYLTAFFPHLAGELVTIGAIGLGLAVGAFEKTLKYVKARIQCGTSLFDAHQVTRHTLAKLWAEIETYRGGLMQTCAMANNGMDVYRYGLMNKMKGSALAESVASQCMELWGGHAVMVENDIERYYRESKMLALGGVSSPLLIELMSKTL